MRFSMVLITHSSMVFCALNLFNNIQAFLSERKNCPPIHDSQGALEYFERQVQLLYDTVKEIIENSEVGSWFFSM